MISGQNEPSQSTTNRSSNSWSPLRLELGPEHRPTYWRRFGLLLGVALGYLFRGSASPAASATTWGESLVVDNRIVAFMSQVAEGTPALELGNPQQIVALPLGSRVKLDPWAGQLEVCESAAASNLLGQRAN